MDFGWHAFLKKPACSFHFRVPPFRNSFVIPPGGFSDNHGHEVIQHGPLIFGRESSGIEAVSAAAQFLVNAWCIDSHITRWKIKHSWNVVRTITCPQAHWVTHFCWETIWNVLSQVMSFTIVKFFFILFYTTVKAFYQRQIPSVTTANV